MSVTMIGLDTAKAAFPSARHFAAWLGPVPRQRSTGGKTAGGMPPAGRITKDGIFRRAWPEASTLRGA